MYANPWRAVATVLATAWCTVSPVPAQDAPAETPPTVESFEEPTTATPGQTNGSAFRFTYPVRDAASDRIYTEANPPAEPGDNVPAPEMSSFATDGGEEAYQTTETVDQGYPDAPSPPLQEFSGGEFPISAGDIGEGRFSKRPYRFSFAVYEGYNSNVNAAPSNGVESLYTTVEAGVSYAFGTSRLQMDLGLSAGMTFYYNSEGLQNDGIFPTAAFTLGANYAATPRLDLSLASSTTLLSQPNYGLSGGTATYQGSYLMSATTLAAEYLWLPKLATETSYSPVVYYYLDPQGDNFSYLDQTIAQQFIFLWKPNTSLVAEYRFNLRNYFELTDYNSLGNYGLLGFDHTFNPRSTMTFRAGAEQRISQNPVSGGTFNYIGPFGQLGFDYTLGPRTKVGVVSRYGTTGTAVNNFSQDVQFLVGLKASHAFGRRLSMGAFANYQNNSYEQPGGEYEGTDLTPSFNYNIFNAGLTASFFLRPDNWSLQAGYAFTTLISSNTDFQEDYTQNIIFLGTRLDF